MAISFVLSGSVDMLGLPVSVLLWNPSIPWNSEVYIFAMKRAHVMEVKKEY